MSAAGDRPLGAALPPASGSSPSFAALAAAVAVCALVCFFVYRGALYGQFISDDRMFVGNPYVLNPGPDLLEQVLRPGGYVQAMAGGNYAPVPILVHTLQYAAFGQHSFGFHVTNVLLHAVNAVLLVAVLCATGVPRVAAFVAGGLFALHPANVEVVAWISQLRALLGMAFALVAFLCFRRYPFLAALPFLLGLFCKASAMFVLPMVAAMCWMWQRQGSDVRRHLWALGFWALAFAVYVPMQFSGFVPAKVELYPDVPTLVRTVAAIGARYAAMAATGYGTSTWHQPEQVQDSLDPWSLTGLALLPVLLWRIVVCVRRGSPEAAYWLGAAAAYAPISQVFPFYYTMADRWMYFVLPGLFGAVIFLGRDVAAWSGGRVAPLVRGGALVAALALAAWFVVRSAERADLWHHADRTYLDAASQYPDGIWAHRIRAYRAMDDGDYEAAIGHLAACAARDGDLLDPFYTDPRLARLADEPAYQALVRNNALRRIAEWERAKTWNQMAALDIANAQFQLGELDAAIETAERGLREGGPYQGELSGAHMRFKAERRRR
jgi:hypothetical protein